ncbi:hypothetical protein L21SP3_00026 [Sedimentisphaera cyanobacteriorum]|uniref:Protein BatD n=1 Tax=Sedimentisphaera cyanobacteriorum TaxID=1940790 RepID=A0A1Q2HLN2_9BACT|nr:BatD family protein [Sedimentisphaera cyanobacteriorum]AQQ08250.1 hypothetical protein L21SP3_00026 [Sedimentisphaera cyanobacteriorum]
MFGRPEIWSLKILVCLACAGLSAFCSAALGEVELSAEISSESVYAGQDFVYQITVQGADSGKVADSSALQEFSPEGPTMSDESRRSITIINGKRRERVSKKFTVSYRLKAKEAGRHTISPVTVEVEGKQYKTESIRFDAKKPQTDERMDIEAVISKKDCFVGEPIELTCSWYIQKQLLQRNLVKDLNFSVPAFNHPLITVEQSNIDKNAKEELEINGLKTGVLQTSAEHNGISSVKVTFSKILIPKAEGQINLGKPGITCKIAVSVNRSGGTFFGRRYNYGVFAAEAENISINVKPLPEESKPANFSGLVGEYKISTQASPVDMKEGDPITLKIKVQGKHLKPVEWPELSEIPAFSENFIIPEEKSSPKISGSTKIFTQTIRTKTDKVSEIPPVEISFFNTEKGEYITAKSKPIDIDVKPAKNITLKDIEGMEDEPVGSDVKSVEGGISENFPADEILYNEKFNLRRELLSPVAAVMWGVPLALFTASAALRLFFGQSEEKKKLRLKRNAIKIASRRIKNAQSLPDEKAREELSRGICEYFSLKFDVPAGSITPEDCKEKALGYTGKEDSERLSEILAKAQASLYSPSGGSFDKNWCKDSLRILRRLEK